MGSPLNPQQQQIFPDDPFGSIKQPIKDDTPEPKIVNRFHTRSDKDSSPTSQHHTLGPGHGQSSPGDHKHDGLSSKALLASITIIGSRADTSATGPLNQLLNALETLGLINSST